MRLGTLGSGYILKVDKTLSLLAVLIYDVRYTIYTAASQWLDERAGAAAW